MVRQTDPIDAHVPVRSERLADPEEEEDAHCGEESDARDESVHPSDDVPSVHDPEKK